MAFKHDPAGDTLEAGMWEVNGTIIRETQKAILLDDGTGEATWLPKSKIRVTSGADGLAAVLLPEWLAKKNGFC